METAESLFFAGIPTIEQRAALDAYYTRRYVCSSPMEIAFEPRHTFIHELLGRIWVCR